MSKTIEKIEKYKEIQLEKAVSRLEQKKIEAIRNFEDTGNYRYQKIIDNCNQELKELDEYIRKGETVTRQLDSEEVKEFFAMKKDLQSLKNKFFYLIKDLGLPRTNDIDSMQDIFKNY